MGQGDMNGQAIDRFIHLEHAWGQKLNLAIVNRRIETKPSEKITEKRRYASKKSKQGLLNNKCVHMTTKGDACFQFPDCILTWQFHHYFLPLFFFSFLPLSTSLLFPAFLFSLSFLYFSHILSCFFKPFFLSFHSPSLPPFTFFFPSSLFILSSFPPLFSPLSPLIPLTGKGQIH